MLHVLNGDSTAYKLGPAGVPGGITVWADILYEGPVPAGVPDEERRRQRARFIADSGYGSYGDALRRYEAWDAALAAAAAHDEVVLWFEHDLFDQLLLVRHLAWFAGRPPAEARGARLSLICIDAYPGVPDFQGLGQLRPDQLAPLLADRRAVTDAQRALGLQAWRAFTASDPSALEALLGADTSALPFLAPALRRLLEEYPSTETGLSRSERSLLALAAEREWPARELYRALRRTDNRLHTTDASFARMVRELAASGRALLALDDPADGGSGDVGSVLERHIGITPLGRDVLAGRADWARLGGVDRWVGGVHLMSPEPGWRWDPGIGRLRNVSSPMPPGH
ncbi:MAG TPA: DUF1835 domain-containing protein [Gemmatimonadaceae bacterium]|nr:DUF1835 domain-containing protein [Gemmatimonadaceae bacterium]